MAAKYYYEFRGTDNVLNRVEIHDVSSVTAKEVTGGASPFLLEYESVDKLKPIRGSGATLGLISKSNFEFIGLHTDDMQQYIVKMYRNGILYWIGWLDSELYTEKLTDATPYPVEFTAADFNILSRLKFVKDEQAKYSDTVSLLTQLKRCFDKLGLPFGKLFIGCSTTIDVALAANETVLHKLSIQSGNFYDEDNEACKCDEVVKSILEPFGLMMVQVGGDIYIYDYNTVKNRLAMKRYDFATLTYLNSVQVDFLLGDIHVIGLSGTDSSLGFEDMINNVKITSSLYGDMNGISDKKEVDENNMSDQISSESGGTGDFRYSKLSYAKCSDWFNDFRFIKYNYASFTGTFETTPDSIIGADLTKRNSEGDAIIYTIPLGSQLLSSNNMYLKIDGKAFVNAKENPFVEDDPPSTATATKFVIEARIYSKDADGNIIQYYEALTGGRDGNGWKNYTGTLNNRVNLWFLASDFLSGSTVLNVWSTLRNIKGEYNGRSFTMTSDDTGLLIPLNGKGGEVVIEISNTYVVFHRELKSDTYKRWGKYLGNILQQIYYPTDVLLNNFSIDIVDSDGKSVNIPDIEFSSYINAKVKTDFEEKTLIVCSANEDGYPLSRGSILIPDTANGALYKCQLSYTRSGQTDILERLLMCTIHSNFTTKKRNIGIDIRGCVNPALKTVTYNNLFDTEFMTMGCTMDFAGAKTSLSASEYSEDTAKLSDIKYV